METKLINCFSCTTMNFQRLKILLVSLLLFIVEYIFLKQFAKLLMVKYTYKLNCLPTGWLIHIIRPHWGKGGGGGGRGKASVLNVQSLFFNQRKLDLHHDQTTYWDKRIFLTRNFPFDSDFRQWNHPLMIPLHWWWAKSNNRARSHFECDVTRFCFVLISFVHMHGGVVVS